MNKAEKGGHIRSLPHNCCYVHCRAGFIDAQWAICDKVSRTQSYDRVGSTLQPTWPASCHSHK